MKMKIRKGLTLIELSIAIITSAIVILATGIVIVLGQSSWTDTWRKVNLQRDASYAMLKISQSVHSAGTAEQDANGTSLDLDNGNIIYSYAADTNDLEYEIGGNTETLIDGKVNNLQFTVSGDTVTIDIILRDFNIETRLVSTIMMRNTGG